MRFIALFVLAAVTAAAQTNAWELGHPDAKLMIGVNLKSLRESSLGQTMRSQMSAQAPPMGPAAMALGFLDQIDRIFISSPSISSPVTPAPRAKIATKAGTKAAPAREQPPFLVVVEGMLPVQQILAFLPGTARPYHSITVYRGAKLTDPSIAALNERTMVIGDDKSVLAAIDRRAGAAPPASAALTRAKELASTYDFWMLTTDNLSKFQPTSDKFPSELAGQIKGIDLGLTARDGLQMEMGMTTASEATAMQLLQLVSAQIAMMQTQSPEAAEAASKLKLATEGVQLRASLSLTKEEFEHSLRSMQAARATGIASAQPAAPAQPAQPKYTQPPRPPGKIRIYGLDEGVREIPLTR